jgi:glycosidase
MNLLSSHDQARSLHVLGWHDDADPAQERLAKARYRLALLLQMSYPGAPAVYYGDEVGLSGGDDPDNRRPFPWADLGGRPDEDLHAEFRRLIALRNALPVLRRGELGAPLHVDAHVIVLPRRLGETVALTITSNAAEARTVAFELPPGVPTQYVDALDGSHHVAQDGRLTLNVPARWGRILQARSP